MNQSKKGNTLFNFIIKYSFVFVLFFSILAPLTVAHGMDIDCSSVSGKFDSSKGFSGLVEFAVCFLNDLVVPFIFALALVAFIWGVMQYYLNPENEEKRAKGKEFIIGGLIALFVMVSVWGILGIFTGTFFSSGSNNAPKIPKLYNAQP